MAGDPTWPSGYDAWSLYKCAALWSAIYGPPATERPPGTIREEKEIFFRFWISIYDLNC